MKIIFESITEGSHCQMVKNENSRSSHNFDSGRGEEHTFMSVRDIAEKAGLPRPTRKESMDICFVGKRRRADFIK